MSPHSPQQCALDVIAAFGGATLAQVMGRTRGPAPVCLRRWLAQWVWWRIRGGDGVNLLSGPSYAATGRAWGRHHVTIMGARAKTRDYLAGHPEVAAEVERIISWKTGQRPA